MVSNKKNGNFIKDEYLLACRLQASLTRSARQIRTHSAQKVKIKGKLKWCALGEIPRTGYHRIDKGTPKWCPERYGNFIKDEYLLACRLQASLTRSARQIRTHSAQKVKIKGKLKWCALGEIPRTGHHRIEKQTPSRCPFFYVKGLRKGYKIKSG